MSESSNKPSEKIQTPKGVALDCPYCHNSQDYTLTDHERRTLGDVFYVGPHMIDCEDCAKPFIALIGVDLVANTYPTDPHRRKKE